MNKRIGLYALVFVVIAALVHGAYLGYIWPAAQLAIDEAREAGLATPRTVAVVLKDVEQEICIILALFCFVLLIEKCYRVYMQRYVFDHDFLQPGDAEKDSASTPLQRLESLPDDIQREPLVQTIAHSFRRFEATRDIQNAADAIRSSVESTAMKLESGNTLIRYFIWTIPSIGFVGTVRGIGAALSEADKALAGDIASMTENLGVAFNSTFVALLLSIVLMGALYLLQGLQDDLVIKIEEYCDEKVVKHMAAAAVDVNA
ncbi:MAG: MotA/TolQ/ExbB proton channel family protein [Pseudomonadota bacterium]